MSVKDKVAAAKRDVLVKILERHHHNIVAELPNLSLFEMDCDFLDIVRNMTVLLVECLDSYIKELKKE